MKPTKRNERVGPSAPTDRKVVEERVKQVWPRGPWRRPVPRRRAWRIRIHPPLVVRVKTNTRYNADAPIRDPDNPPRTEDYVSPVTRKSYPVWE